MASSSKICFEAKKKFETFYSGGKTVWSVDGEYIYCKNVNGINVVSTKIASEIRCFNAENIDALYDDDLLLTFDVSTDNRFLVTAEKSGLIKLWDLSNSEVVKKWKSNHIGIISNLIFGPNNDIVCSCGTDNKIRIWDFSKNTQIGVLEVQGIVTILKFYPHADCSSLYVVGDDNVINGWNFLVKNHLCSLGGHLSRVTGLTFHDTNVDLLASVSMDKVLIIWHLSNGTKFKVIPLYESLQGIIFLPNNSMSSIGVKMEVDDDETTMLALVVDVLGSTYLINCDNSNVLQTKRCLEFVEHGKHSNMITDVMHCKSTNEFALVTSENNILIFDVDSIENKRQLVGSNDEILDMCLLGTNDECLAIATNSTTIKVYNIENGNCIIVFGHTDTVLTLSGYENHLLSAGKDLTIMIWKLESDFKMRCIVKYTAHTSAVSSISLSYKSLSMFTSADQCGCMKIWSLSKKKKNVIENDSNRIEYSLKNSVRAHDKEINCVTYSPNNNLIASGSQDKTVKIWQANDLSLLSTLQGHRRGVWCVRFSPIDQILASASADCTIRIWSMTSHACMMKIDEESAIVRIEFMPTGRHFISGASDGIIKVWGLKSSECIAKHDEHNDRVWAIAVAKDGEIFFTAGADSNIITWCDVTDQKIQQNIEEKVAQNRQQQILSNYIKEDRIEKALSLALSLNKPLICYKIIRDCIKMQKPILKDAISELTATEMDNLLSYMKLWNSNTRYCKVAQYVLFFVLNEMLAHNSSLCNSNNLVRDMSSYTERHYKRISRYVEELNIIDYAIKLM